ncbi:MAG TPA: hypothetical protein VHY22_06510 [Chthoniobacteraceae bacterium]|jgi:hypothetical protein|nr:hypothetical protein [Chthoniobacteraceae bacterium]
MGIAHAVKAGCAPVPANWWKIVPRLQRRPFREVLDGRAAALQVTVAVNDIDEERAARPPDRSGSQHMSRFGAQYNPALIYL